MALRQKYTPNVGVKAKRGWCLMYVDDAGKAPKRTPNAHVAYENEVKAKRIRTGHPPVGIWVVGFASFSAGPYINLGHVFLMKYIGNGKYEIRDSETNSGMRGIYNSIDELLGWFGAYKPIYRGYSTHCDGRQYAEDYTPPSPVKGKAVRKAAKGIASVLVNELNVRNSPSTKAKIVARYKKGQTFNYDSYIVANGYVWLSYVSHTGVRRYVAEGPNDGKENTVYVAGGV